MKKVLIMGGSYFIGRKIAEQFVANGDEVYLLNRGTKPALKNTISLICDRNNPEALKETLSSYQFHIVIDVSGLDQSQAISLLNALDKTALEHFIFISSSAVYAVDSLKAPFSETDTLGENHYWTAYGTNKIEAEACYTSVFQGTNTTLIMLRPPYVFGENNYAQRESFLFHSIEQNRPIFIPQNNPLLQFISTTDLADTILALIKISLNNINIFNVGNAKAISAKEWAEACMKVANKIVPIISYNYQENNHTVRDFFPFYDYDNVLEVSSLKKLYSYETDFTEELSKAYQWYLTEKETITFKPEVEENIARILKLL